MKWIPKTSMAVACAIVILASLLAVIPCLAVTGPGSGVASPDKPKLTSVKSIQIRGAGDAAELIISLSAPATYTSYKTTAPLRLVLDISQTTQGDITSPLVFNTGNFKSVTTNRFDSDAGVLTRIYIELNKDAEAVISDSKNNPGELKISFPASVSTVKTPAPAVARLQPEVKPSPATARSLTDVAVKNNTIVLSVNGGASDFTSFRLNKPERFVVDVPGAISLLPSRVIPLNVSGVASARIGLYPEKVRIVLDSVDGSFPEATAAASPEGVTVTLNIKQTDNPNTKLVAVQAAKEPVAAEKTVAKPKPVVAEPAKPVVVDKPIAKPVAKSEKYVSGLPASVEMIDFQVVENISRVAVKVRGDVTVDPPVKSAGFVTLTVKNATIQKQLQRSLDAHSFISPVLRVTPLVVKTRSGSDIKIRIAMRATAPYDFRQEGDMLFVDFTNPPSKVVEKSADAQAAKRTSVKQTKLNESKSTDISAELASSTIPVPSTTSTGKVYSGRKVTLEFADAEVRKIFQLLSEVSGKNFVLGDDVTGTISLKLVNVPWDQALDIIMDTKNLDMRDNGNVLTIKGKGKFKTQEEEAQELKKILNKSIELKSETFLINYSTAAEIDAQLKPLLTPDRGKTTIDTRTNKIIVRDVPQAIDDMRKLIAMLDVPEKQVMIEARIVEASTSFTRDLGVAWGIHKNTKGVDAATGLVSSLLNGGNNINSTFGGLASAASSSGVNSLPGAQAGISFGMIGANINVEMRLSAAAAAGLVKIVSSPKVATLNNKTAKISQGQQIPYLNTTATTGTVTQFVSATLSLEVTPHINSNGTIGLKIDAKNDAPGTGSPPPINTKQATTEMLLRDGETTVIGGIYVDSEADSVEGVPFLMDIPLLGNLFKDTSIRKSKSELLIFITPRILSAI